MLTISTSLQEAVSKRNLAYPNDPSKALFFPPVHAWFPFEGKDWHASWNGNLWLPNTDKNGRRWPHMYIVEVAESCQGTGVGSMQIHNGVGQVPDMALDSVSGGEERNLRLFQAANAAILAKVGAGHVLRWGKEAPRGLDCPPLWHPKPAAFLDCNTAFDACYTFGVELRRNYPDLTDAEIDAAFQMWEASFAQGSFSKEGLPVPPVLHRLKEGGGFACHEGYVGKKNAYTPLVLDSVHE